MVSPLLPLLQRFTADKGRSGLRCCRSGWRRMCRSSPDRGSRLRVRDVRGLRVTGPAYGTFPKRQAAAEVWPTPTRPSPDQPLQPRPMTFISTSPFLSYKGIGAWGHTELSLIYTSHSIRRTLTPTGLPRPQLSSLNSRQKGSEISSALATLTLHTRSRSRRRSPHRLHGQFQ